MQGARRDRGWAGGEKGPLEAGEGSCNTGNLASELHGLGEIPLESKDLGVASGEWVTQDVLSSRGPTKKLNPRGDRPLHPMAIAPYSHLDPTVIVWYTIRAPWNI